MDSDYEAYILLLLSDSNLPTGSFVASAGLESYVTHGFLQSSSLNDKLSATTDFVRNSLCTYARSALPFVSDSHKMVEALCSCTDDGVEDMLVSTLNRIKALDDLYEVMTLNHVARRASKSQGVALLTLYSKSFSRQAQPDTNGLESPAPHEVRAAKFVDKLKLEIRREQTHGHLPICWGVLTSSLGLSLGRSQFLHLFLHARSLLSASVRLNTLGPYAAQQLLLHAVRPLVEAEATRCRELRTGYENSGTSTESSSEEQPSSNLDEITHGPAITWPLGEILAARHDLQHSRIFNS